MHRNMQLHGIEVTTLCKDNVNPEQQMEMECNFIAEQVQKKIKLATSQKEKEDLIFKFLSLVNENQCKFFWNLYQDFDRVEIVDHTRFHLFDDRAKKKFIQDVEDNGFYLIRPPHKPLLYDDIAKLYKAFPDIKPVPMYVDLFGIKKRRILHDGVSGYKYILVLKQNSNKNFSARSTFRVNRVNLPAKDVTKKTNRASYAKSPIRLSEIYALMSSVSGRTLAEYDVFTRSSALGRKSLDRILSTDGNPLAIKKIKIKNDFINTNADILAARLFCIGIAIDYRVDDMTTPDLYDSRIIQMDFGPFTIFDTAGKRPMYADLFRRFNEWLRSDLYMGMSREEIYDLGWDTVFNDPEVQEYEIADDIKEMIKNCYRGQKPTAPQHEEPTVDEEEEERQQQVHRRRGRRSKTTSSTTEEA